MARITDAALLNDGIDGIYLQLYYQFEAWGQSETALIVLEEQTWYHTKTVVRHVAV